MDDLSSLRGRSLELARDKPRLWEVDLFVEVLSHELRSCQELKMEHELALVLGPVKKLSVAKAPKWHSAKLEELVIMIKALGLLVQAASEAMTASSASKIPFVARKLGGIYRQWVGWALSIRRTSIDDRLAEAQNLMAHLGDGIGSVIESLAASLREQAEQVRNSDCQGDDYQIEVKMDLSAPSMDECFAAWNTAMRAIQEAN